MAKFTIEQAAAVVAINQLINDWSIELDIDNGANILGLITEDCSYNVGGSIRNSSAEVAQFYAERKARLARHAGRRADPPPCAFQSSGEFQFRK